jgi:hypothetical protein
VNVKGFHIRDGMSGRNRVYDAGPPPTTWVSGDPPFTSSLAYVVRGEKPSLIAGPYVCVDQREGDLRLAG